MQAFHGELKATGRHVSGVASLVIGLILMCSQVQFDEVAPRVHSHGGFAEAISISFFFPHCPGSPPGSHCLCD